MGILLEVTKNIASVELEQRERRFGDTTYTFKKLIGLWFNGFTAFSVKPLRIATFIGGISSLCGFAYGIFTIINKLINPDIMVGWSSLIAVIVFMSGIILLVLGMIGEYVGRIYISINDSPQYIIKEKICSKEENDD